MQKIITIDHLEDYAAYIDQTVIEYIGEGQIETYESFAAYDLIAFDWYDPLDLDTPPAQILLYIDKDDLFFICENEIAYLAADRLFCGADSNEQAMYLFFKNLLRGSNRYLERMGARVAALDDDVSDGTEEGLRERLMSMRNEILRASSYYEQMEFLLEEICDNDNDLLGAECIKNFEVLRNRSVRFVSQARDLREYITQVRESYQAQIGIEQNNLMKVFTLVTSIFLPLTLIVGWYGMNLRMPEFGWRYGYLFVAGLSIAVCAIWIVVFKKKKWLK